MSKIGLLPASGDAHHSALSSPWATTQGGLTGTSAAVETLQILSGTFQILIAEVVEEVQGDCELSVFLLAPAVHPLPDQGEVDLVETRELPHDLLVRTTDNAPLDLREVGVGNAGRRFHIAQSQAPMGAGAPQEMAKIRFSPARLGVGRRLNRRLSGHPYRLGQWIGIPSFRRTLRDCAKALRFVLAWPHE
jgi:hypothetical protein